MRRGDSLPQFGKSSSFNFIPENDIVWIFQVIGKTAIKLGLLRFRQWRYSIAADDAIPDGLSELDLLVNGKHSG